MCNLAQVTGESWCCAGLHVTKRRLEAVLALNWGASPHVEK